MAVLILACFIHSMGKGGVNKGKIDFLDLLTLPGHPNT